jgi:hypothetical protein
MNNHGARARATIDAWREQGADRLDAIRFHYMDALERRAADQEGEVRRMLDEKLATLLKAYAGDLKKADARKAEGSKSPAASARETLGSLVEHMASHDTTSFSELAILDTFRKIWSRLHNENQLRQALDHLPTNAGPLNSSALVHRSIMLMREFSPGYLQQFLSYVDALSWMEQMNDAVALAAKDAARPASAKRARKK